MFFCDHSWGPEESFWKICRWIVWWRKEMYREVFRRQGRKDRKEKLWTGQNQIAPVVPVTGGALNFTICSTPLWFLCCKSANILFFFCFIPSFISEVYHFWYDFCICDFFFFLQSNHRSSHIPSSRMMHAGCVFVVGIHPSRTWMSGSFESVQRNACVHGPDLAL